LNAEIMNGMDVLDEREKQVITLIYGLTGSPYTMAEIAYHMGLKRERVRQIRDKALRKLHKRMK
ncbi:sigma factor-like helix-turn-helix DNA-binding protein, partial [Prevotella histicola]